MRNMTERLRSSENKKQDGGDSDDSIAGDTIFIIDYLFSDCFSYIMPRLDWTIK